MGGRMKDILTWETPKKKRSTKDHNELYQTEEINGAYVPNMSKDDEIRWKAKRIGGKDLRIEIRKTTEGHFDGNRHEGSAQTLIVVRPNGTVMMSMNGKAEFDGLELKQVLDEACAALVGGI